MTLVGVGEFNTSVVEDDMQRVPTYVLFRGLHATVAQCCSYSTITNLRIDDPGRYTTTVESAIEQTFPKGTAFFIHETAVNQIKAERSIKPESIALAVFGLIAALAALLIAGQAIGRQLRLDEDDLATLRALGAGPAMTSVDGLPGAIVAVVAGRSSPPSSGSDCRRWLRSVRSDRCIPRKASRSTGPCSASVS